MDKPEFAHIPPGQIPSPIAELALDLRWSWNHATDDLWRDLDADLWEATRNPWLIVQSVSR